MNRFPPQGGIIYKGGGVGAEPPADRSLLCSEDLPACMGELRKQIADWHILPLLDDEDRARSIVVILIGVAISITLFCIIISILTIIVIIFSGQAATPASRRRRLEIGKERDIIVV